MHIKFLPHGTNKGGSCGKAMDYLLGAKDHKGEIRPDVQALKGDPYAVAAVADALEFSRCYTSGLITWAAEDAPTDEHIESVLSDWERLSFAGLEPDRYAFAAVLHREADGGVHVHTITARVDLETGKALNIAPPGHEQHFDTLRDKWNFKEGWARPDDPVRARLLSPDFEAYAIKNSGSNQISIKNEITDHLIEAVARGVVSNAKELREYVTDVLNFEITRTGATYLSVKPDGFDRAIRLKGELFGDGWTAEKTVIREATADEKRGGARDEGRYATAQLEFDRACKHRANYNAGRYSYPKRRDSNTLDAAASTVENTQADRLQTMDKHPRDVLDSFNLHGRVVVDASTFNGHSDPMENGEIGRIEHGNSSSKRGTDHDRKGSSIVSQGGLVPENNEWSEIHRIDNEAGGVIPSAGQKSSVVQKMGSGDQINDRVRTAVTHSTGAESARESKFQERNSSFATLVADITERVRSFGRKLQQYLHESEQGLDDSQKHDRSNAKLIQGRDEPTQVYDRQRLSGECSGAFNLESQLKQLKRDCHKLDQGTRELELINEVREKEAKKDRSRSMGRGMGM